MILVYYLAIFNGGGEYLYCNFFVHLKANNTKLTAYEYQKTISGRNALMPSML